MTSDQFLEYLNLVEPTLTTPKIANMIFWNFDLMFCFLIDWFNVLGPSEGISRFLGRKQDSTRLHILVDDFFKFTFMCFFSALSYHLKHSREVSSLF